MKINLISLVVTFIFAMWWALWGAWGMEVYNDYNPTVIHDTIIKPQYLCFVVDDFKPCEVDVDYLASLSLD